MIPAWIQENSYTDVPYLNLGRDPRGWDCYGLVTYISQKHFGKILPDVHTYMNACDHSDVINTINSQLVAWKKVVTPESGGVLLFNFRGHPVHCAMVLDHQWMLHVQKNCLTAVEDYTQQKWIQRYDGAYTYTG